MEPSFELFDHTADIGIRVRAPTLAGLLEPAAEGLYTVIGELVPGAEPREMTVELGGSEAAVLLRDYLDELLVLFDRDHRRAGPPTVAAFDDTRLIAKAKTRAVDRERSTYHREVKAVTYHRLSIHPVEGGYEATFIVDI